MSPVKPTVNEFLNYSYASMSNGFSVKDIVTGADNVKSEVVQTVEDRLLKPLGLCENTSSQSALSTN